jgi:quercetin dioxygenase-like cupin family protein
MIRLVRLCTGADGQSHGEDRTVPLERADAPNLLSKRAAATSICFEETAARAALDWHNDPHRRYVITLAGTVAFETRSGETFVIAPGDILLAEDETGGGHRWRLLGGQPWRRAHVAIPHDEAAIS